MFNFIIRGLFRDRTRYLFPILIVIAGVSIIVFFIAIIEGYLNSMIQQNANFDTGDVKVVTRAYSDLLSQKPYDLGLLNVSELLSKWKKQYPSIQWAERISFGALLDVPDAHGVTLEQGQVGGIAIDMMHDKNEITRFHLDTDIKSGHLPKKPGEILISQSLFDKLHLKLNQKVTLIGSTMYGSMSFKNATIAGTVVFGIEVMDRGGIFMDLADARGMLDMNDAAGEILGFFPNNIYNDKYARNLQTDFNRRYSKTDDQYSPYMVRLSEQNHLDYVIGKATGTFAVMTFIFLLLMSIVLWNSGLMNGIRRYGEYGVRLAMGEEKGHLYRWHVIESVVIGVVGTAIGLGFGYLVVQYFHVHGFDMSAYAAASTIMFENIVHTNMSLKALLYGIMPGIFATAIGGLLSGMGIYKRQTSQLFKELET
jgi:putative ABC transport system permease protein